jgi:hypothetical protein
MLKKKALYSLTPLGGIKPLVDSIIEMKKDVKRKKEKKEKNGLELKTDK